MLSLVSSIGQLQPTGWADDQLIRKSGSLPGAPAGAPTDSHAGQACAAADGASAAGAEAVRHGA